MEESTLVPIIAMVAFAVIAPFALRKSVPRTRQLASERPRLWRVMTLVSIPVAVAMVTVAWTVIGGPVWFLVLFTVLAAAIVGTNLWAVFAPKG